MSISLDDVSIECPHTDHRNASSNGVRLVDDPQCLAKVRWCKGDAAEDIGTNGKGPAMEQFGADAQVCTEQENRFILFRRLIR